MATSVNGSECGSWVTNQLSSEEHGLIDEAVLA